MTPETIFDIANPLALLGWICLALAPLAPRAAHLVAARIIPLTFAVFYIALVLVYWAQAGGGYGSLSEVMTLLANPGMATAGWIHFLAFDLFVGAWITQDAVKRAVPHLAILPCLGLTFMFGPAGLLAYLTLAFLLSLRRPNAEARLP